jgi:hypothetical protein
VKSKKIFSGVHPPLGRSAVLLGARATALMQHLRRRFARTKQLRLRVREKPAKPRHS